MSSMDEVYLIYQFCEYCSRKYLFAVCKVFDTCSVCETGPLLHGAWRGGDVAC
jgi:hypothetical protein